MAVPPIGPVYGKAWGTTQSLFELNGVEVNRLITFNAGFSSEHIHNQKWSRFFAISGKIRVVIFREDSAKDTTILTSGMCTDVPPGVWHKFEVVEDSDVIEIYWVVLEKSDIERRTIGGSRETKIS
jgi:mannose-6-phosphate isomerase-like protein (cupin superfamily)